MGIDKMAASAIKIEEFDYPLPEEAIAFSPLEKRDDSRLLIFNNGEIEDEQFSSLSHLLPYPCSLFLNNTRVIRARILFKKETGGQIQVFCLEPVDSTPEIALITQGSCRWKCMIGGASKWKPGRVLESSIGNGQFLRAIYESKESDSFIIRFEWDGEATFTEVLQICGAMPLPPYIKREAEENDAERYQTVFAKHNGSVAAPTASLHFTPDLLQHLQSKGGALHYLTLHVGAGTFKPVKSETISDHEMHAELIRVSAETIRALQTRNPSIAVGTTSLRTLESLYWMGFKLLQGREQPFVLQQWEAYDLGSESLPPTVEVFKNLEDWMKEKNIDSIEGSTSLIIVPGYRFKTVSGLITNFHQPRSTLLLLIAAFVGEDWKKIYNHALKNNYRFLSYGDSSLLWSGMF